MANVYKIKSDAYLPEESEMELALTGPKLHGIQVTESNINYHGSITLDMEFLELSGLYPLEFVHIWNKNSGSRISTYVLPGERGSKICCMNGAAARTCQSGDQLIITSERRLKRKILNEYIVKVLMFSANNVISEIIKYKLNVTENSCTFCVESKI